MTLETIFSTDGDKLSDAVAQLRTLDKASHLMRIPSKFPQGVALVLGVDRLSDEEQERAELAGIGRAEFQNYYSNTMQERQTAIIERDAIPAMKAIHSRWAEHYEGKANEARKAEQALADKMGLPFANAYASQHEAFAAEHRHNAVAVRYAGGDPLRFIRGCGWSEDGTHTEPGTDRPSVIERIAKALAA